MVDAIGENTIQMFTHLMQWFTGSNPVLTTKKNKNMEIPLVIKRRYLDIEQYLDRLLKNYSHYPKVTIKESFINHACNNLSLWFVTKYTINKDNGGYHVQIKEYRSIFVYMFRTRISIYWEEN